MKEGQCRLSLPLSPMRTASMGLRPADEMLGLTRSVGLEVEESQALDLRSPLPALRLVGP